MNSVRRRFLLGGLVVAGTALTGCGGSDDSSPVVNSPAPSPSAPATWTPNVPALTANSGATFDLSASLPSGVTRGGTFSIDPSGARLPAGMSLSSSGVIAVGTAALGTVTGVIFTYDAP